MNVPYYLEVRHRIEEVQDLRMQMLLKALYLFGARISEMTAKRYTKDVNAPSEILGPKGTHVKLYEFRLTNHKSIEDAESSAIDNIRGIKEMLTEKSFDEVEDALKFAVFRLNVEECRTEKDEENVRYVALPISNVYEPWAKGLCEYFFAKGNNYVFPFYRQDAQEYIRRKRVFEGLTYPIEYCIYGNAVNYQKRLGMDGLRLVRMAELSTRYGFDQWDMDAYGILKFRVKGVHEQVLDDGKKYSDPWKRYIIKLCKRNIAYICKKCGHIEFSE